MNIRLLAVVLLLVCFNARADSLEFSASYRCDQAADVFSILPIVETSGDFNIKLAHGYIELHRYQELQQGKDNISNLQCKLKHHTITLEYLSLAPQASGMCRGIGFTEIQSLKIDDQQILGREEINSGCFFEDTLVSLKLHMEASHFTIERCTAKKWDGNKGYENYHCTKKRFALTHAH